MCAIHLRESLAYNAHVFLDIDCDPPLPSAHTFESAMMISIMTMATRMISTMAPNTRMMNKKEENGWLTLFKAKSLFVFHKSYLPTLSHLTVDLRMLDAVHVPEIIEDETLRPSSCLHFCFWNVYCCCCCLKVFSVTLQLQ